MDERRKASISSLWLGDMEGARPTWTGATPAPACLAVLEFTSAGQPPQAGEHDLPEYRAHEDGPTVPVREHCAAAGAGGLVRGPIRRLMYHQASLNLGQQCKPMFRWPTDMDPSRVYRSSPNTSRWRRNTQAVAGPDSVPIARSTSTSSATSAGL